MLSKPFLTTHDVPELPEVRERTFRTWDHDRDLRAVGPGRDFRVAITDPEAFFNDHATRDPGRAGTTSGDGS